MCLQDCGNETTYFETIYGAKKKKKNHKGN